MPAVTATTDQAASLRKLVSASKTTTVPRKGRVISVTSGKGGVGKTNISINLAYALASMGRRVYLLDADLGLANIDVLLNLTPAYTIDDVLSGEMELRDIIADGPGNIKVLPSSSGVVEMAELDEDRQAHLLEKLKDLDDDMDYLIIDTGAGIAANVLRFSVCADEIILVVAATTGEEAGWRKLHLIANNDDLFCSKDSRYGIFECDLAGLIKDATQVLFCFAHVLGYDPTQVHPKEIHSKFASNDASNHCLSGTRWTIK